MEVTPELSDGYEGVVRKLVCLDCRNPFYIAKDDYERIHSRYCHACSLRRIGVEHRRTKRPILKEVVDQAGQAVQHAQADEMKIEVFSPEDKRRERHMTELEKEIFWKLLIDLFLERPEIEKRLAEKQRSMDDKAITQTAHKGSIEDFSKNPIDLSAITRRRLMRPWYSRKCTHSLSNMKCGKRGLQVAKKMKPSTNEARINESLEQIPVVTPEIEDGYNGIVKRLVCLGCQHVFYLTETDYHSLHPTHCHICSTRLVAEYEARRQQELTEQEQKAKGEIILALLADLAPKDTPEEAFVRGLVESNFKKDWNYGYTMLLCVPHHTEQMRMWHVVLTKDEENPKRSIHIRLLLIEWSKNAHMYLPLSKSIHYEKSLEAQLEEIDRLIEREPTKSKFYEMKADTLVKLGEAQQALLWYDRAMELGTPNSYPYCSKGDVLARLDRAGEAMECFEKVISLEPDNIVGYAHKGRLLEQLGRGEEALVLYDAFIAAHPSDLQGYLQKAMWFTKRDKYEEAHQIHLQGKLAGQKAD